MSEWKASLPVKNPTEEVTHVEVSVSYDKGGPNYWSGGTDRRGVYVIATPIRIRDRMVSFIIGRGSKRLAEEMKRKNQKVIDKVVADVQKQISDKAGIFWDMVQRVCVSVKCELADETPVIA
jgi:hypothetical protein